MALTAGYHDVPRGKIALAVTSLEMLARPALRPVPPGDLAIRRVPSPDLGWYRDLFRRIGSDWLWFSRLAMSDAELAAIVHDPAVEVYAVTVGDRADGGNADRDAAGQGKAGMPRAGADRDVGLLELDFRVAGECEIAFFGVTAPYIGGRVARHLMNHAIAAAWSRPIGRFWVHTCTGDHPKAVAFYVRSGFVPFRIQVEIADDPRLAGILPACAAPHVPLIQP